MTPAGDAFADALARYRGDATPHESGAAFRRYIADARAAQARSDVLLRLTRDLVDLAVDASAPLMPVALTPPATVVARRRPSRGAGRHALAAAAAVGLIVGSLAPAFVTVSVFAVEPTEVILPSSLVTASITTTLPVRLPSSGTVTVDLTLTGGGATIAIPQGTSVTQPDGKPFGGQLYPPSARTETAIGDAIQFSSSAGMTLRFAAPASPVSAGAPGLITFSVPLATSVASSRIVRLDPLNGGISTFKGRVSADGSRLTFESTTLGTFAAADQIDLGRAASAPFVWSEIPVRFPGRPVGPTVTLSGPAGTLALRAGTYATVRGLNAAFSGTLAPPLATTVNGVSNGAALVANVPDGITFDRAAALTLLPPAGQGGAFVPIRLGASGSLICMTGPLSAYGVAMVEITTTVDTYALLGMARPAAASAERSARSEPGYHSAWVGQSAPAALCPHQQVEVTVLIRNSGDVAWTRGTPSQVVLGSNGPPGNTADFDIGILKQPLYNRDRYGTYAEDVVRPGEVGTFTFRLQAPAFPGTYRVDVRPVVEGLSWLEDEGIHYDVVVR